VVPIKPRLYCVVISQLSLILSSSKDARYPLVWRPARVNWAYVGARPSTAIVFGSSWFERISRDCIEDNEQFSGNGDKGNLCRFSGLFKLGIEGFEVRVMAGCG